jgi:hypothetical protein
VSALSRVEGDVGGGGGVTWLEGACPWRCKYSIPSCVLEKGGEIAREDRGKQRDKEVVWTPKWLWTVMVLHVFVLID